MQGVNLGTGRPCSEEGSHTLFGDVLNVDDRDALSIGLGDGLLDVLKDDIRVPQRKLATGEVIVLKVNYQQCFGHSQSPILSSSSSENLSPRNEPRVACHDQKEHQRNPGRYFPDFSFQ